jgi:hypothetical protein
VALGYMTPVCHGRGIKAPYTKQRSKKGYRRYD